MELKKYFPKLSEDQLQKFAQLPELYQFWNDQINVISRKDMEHFETRHLLHSLAIGKVIHFSAGSKLLDVGTGGGFPGIPLAILFPDAQFHLVDGIGKKIKVVTAVAEALNLKNVVAEHKRAEEMKGNYDFILSRAVTALPAFIPWTQGKISRNNRNSLKNGILYLKGGDFAEELTQIPLQHKLFPIASFFEDEFFETKYVVHLY